MATIVNNPGYTGESSSSSSALTVGIVLLVVAVLAILFFGRGFGAANTGESSGGVTVPDRINVDVNTPAQPAQ